MQFTAPIASPNNNWTISVVSILSLKDKKGTMKLKHIKKKTGHDKIR